MREYTLQFSSAVWLRSGYGSTMQPAEMALLCNFRGQQYKLNDGDAFR